MIVGLPFYSRLWCETPADSESDKTDNSQVFVDNSDGTYDSKNNKYLLSSKGVSMEGENNIIREHDLSLTGLMMSVSFTLSMRRMVRGIAFGSKMKILWI